MKLLPIPQPGRDIVEAILKKKIAICEWAGDQAIYLQSVISEAVESLGRVVLSMFGPILAPILTIWGAVRQMIGEAIMNIYLALVAPKIYRAYNGNMTQALMDAVYMRDRFIEKVKRVSSIFPTLLNIGKIGFSIMPASEKNEIILSTISATQSVLATKTQENQQQKEEINSETAAKAALVSSIDKTYSIEDIQAPVYIGKLDRQFYPVPGLVKYWPDDSFWSAIGLTENPDNVNFDELKFGQSINWFLGVSSGVLESIESLFAAIFGSASVDSIVSVFGSLKDELLELKSKLENYYDILLSLRPPANDDFASTFEKHKETIRSPVILHLSRQVSFVPNHTD